RHLSYADLEAEMRIKDAKQGVRFSFKKALFSKNLTEKRFHQKGLFYKLPARPLIKWLYMIFFRFAFLDGRVGLQYAALQSVYEYFIVLKTNELTSVQKKTN
ncbi:MAG TPA: hypothetical protein VK622_17320, partial [Puia sp.]|nr:hypothetical protein [Puia sp.]